MSRYRLLEGLDCPYFITCTVNRWQTILIQKPIITIIKDALAYMQIENHAFLYAYVIMPSHLHAIVKAPEGKNIANLMRDFKRFTSREIRKVLSSNNVAHTGNKPKYFHEMAQNGKGNKYILWKRGYHPQALLSKNIAIEKINYIHHNPQKSGLVESDTDWPYSSARFYYLGLAVFPAVDPFEL